jgi:hypothetical protein
VSRVLKSSLISAFACCALLAPGSASAATVVNGGFESGNLDGWTQVHSEAGEWAAYFGNLIPSEREKVEEEEVEYEECLEGALDPEECAFDPEPEIFFPPPSGTYAAVTQQGFISEMAIYQDVALEPGQTHQLAMTLSYSTFEAITVPSPNSLQYDGRENEQFRVDVIKPSAPIFSVEPGDILATVFANKPGDPTRMGFTRFSTDLSAFAGQTVRIRLGNVVSEGELNAGADDIAITSTPIPPSNQFTKGKLTLNKKKGTAALSVTVPGPGVLSFADSKKGKKKVLKATGLNSTGAGTLKVAIKPNGKGKKALKKKGKLQFKGNLTFTPTGGSAATQGVKGKLKLQVPRS